MIGVCIKYYNENYGGMLQAYATTKLLDKMGIDYELIRYKKKITLSGVIKSVPRCFNGVLQHEKKELVQKKISKVLHNDFKRNDDIRLEAFHKFSDNNFKKVSPIYFGMDALKKGASKYSAVVSGSDQLWSPSGLPTNFYNLMFVPDKTRKITIASSFGVRNIPWYQKNRTKLFLQRIDYISMREIRGSEIVRELIGRKVPTILDPVFLFSADEWRKMIKSEEIYKESYIFAYFLGTNQQYRQEVKKAANELGCKIVTIRHADQYVKEDESFGDYAPYDVDPAKFLNLLRNASYVCTDSFHASVFAIINHLPFIVFNRFSNKAKSSKNSRIDSLCDMLKIKDCRFKEHIELVDQLNTTLNYKEVDKQIELLKKKTFDYLDLAFGKV